MTYTFTEGWKSIKERFGRRSMGSMAPAPMVPAE
jgi:hypothetical protein